MNEKRTVRPFPFIPHPSSLIPIFLLLITSCGSRQGQPGTQANPVEINVAAASNLSDAFAELGKQFTERTGVRVVYSFGATADLTRQIEGGAPFDLFASADSEHVDKLDREGLIAQDTKSPYARGRLVLWVPADSPLKLASVEDITRAEFGRIAVAKPDLAPYGRATLEALRTLNLWPRVEPKVIYAQNVSQAKQYAATGNAEAAFIPLALVRPGEGQKIEIDESLHSPIIQSIAVLKDSPRQTAARAFTSFVLSPEGQSTLERFGYRRP